MSRPNKIVPLPSRAPDTQLELTRNLADAFGQVEQAERALQEARASLDAVFPRWAAGRRISRDEAREQLISTGHLLRKAD